MGHEHLIEHEKGSNKYYETREFEDGVVSKYIEDQDEEIFWTELASKLGFRDAARLQKLKTEEMDRDSFLKEAWSKENDYLEEFEKNGLENVNVTIQKDDKRTNGD